MSRSLRLAAALALSLGASAAAEFAPKIPIQLPNSSRLSPKIAALAPRASAPAILPMLLPILMPQEFVTQAAPGRAGQGKPRKAAEVLNQAAGLGEADAAAHFDGASGALTFPEMVEIFKIGENISQSYVSPVKAKKLYYGALRGMAAALDPYSEFFDPKEYREFNKQGRYAGVGVGLADKKEGEAQAVLYTLAHSPAAKAGIQGGDRILEINGASVLPLSQEEVREKLSGRVGSKVALKIAREDPATKKDGFLDIPLKRKSVDAPNVYSKMLPEKTGYLYFQTFYSKTGAEVIEQIRALKAQGASSLILDLRGNGGGSVAAAIEIAGAFLRKGQLVMRSKTRQGEKQETVVPEDGEFLTLPLKVLVNGDSASASEIFAGAMRDYKRGLIVGSRTFGKGVTQQIVPFDDGSALKLTTERWYTPLGRAIQKSSWGRGGIAPDVAVEIAEDTEMLVMGQVLRELYRLPVERAVPDPALEKALKTPFR